MDIFKVAMIGLRIWPHIQAIERDPALKQMIPRLWPHVQSIIAELSPLMASAQPHIDEAKRKGMSDEAARVYAGVKLLPGALTPEQEMGSDRMSGQG